MGERVNARLPELLGGGSHARLALPETPHLMTSKAGSAPGDSTNTMGVCSVLAR